MYQEDYNNVKPLLLSRESKIYFILKLSVEFKIYFMENVKYEN